MLHAEEPKKYQSQFKKFIEDCRVNSVEDPPDIDFELEAQIAAQIFCSFVKTYGQNEMPHRGSHWTLVEQACQYSRMLLFILHNERIEERKRRDAYASEED